MHTFLCTHTIFSTVVWGGACTIPWITAMLTCAFEVISWRSFSTRNNRDYSQPFDLILDSFEKQKYCIATATCALPHYQDRLLHIFFWYFGSITVLAASIGIWLKIYNRSSMCLFCTNIKLFMKKTNDEMTINCIWVCCFFSCGCFSACKNGIVLDYSWIEFDCTIFIVNWEIA